MITIDCRPWSYLSKEEQKQRIEEAKRILGEERFKELQEEAREDLRKRKLKLGK